MKHKLTNEEQQIEREADQLRPVSAQRREEIESIIRRAHKNCGFRRKLPPVPGIDCHPDRLPFSLISSIPSRQV